MALIFSNFEDPAVRNKMISGLSAGESYDMYSDKVYKAESVAPTFSYAGAANAPGGGTSFYDSGGTPTPHSPDYGFGQPSPASKPLTPGYGLSSGGSSQPAQVIRSSGSSGNYSSTQSTSWTPNGAMPTTTAGKFAAPEFDEKRITELAQRFAAPSIRSMRGEMRRATAPQYEDNPNARAQTLRGALAGYGQGLENAVAGSYKQALSQYNVEHGRKWNEAMTNFTAKETARAQNFQTAVNSWLKQGTTTTTANRTSGAATAAAAASEKAGQWATLSPTIQKALRQDNTKYLTPEEKATWGTNVAGYQDIYNAYRGQTGTTTTPWNTSGGASGNIRTV